MDGLLDFRVEVSLDGEALTDDEIDELLAATHGLALLRGKWVEVDAERLRATLDKFQAIERLSAKEGVPFGEAMRLLAGADIGAAGSAAPTAQWAHVQAGPWLAKSLESCRSPEGLASADPGDGLKATLRPYQRTGVQWLYFLTQLGLGACLADDMGLGKTIQVLALLAGPRPADQRRRAKDAESSRGAGVAARQLGAGSGAVHAGAENTDRPPLVPAGGGIARDEREAARSRRSRGDELRHAVAP